MVSVLIEDKWPILHTGYRVYVGLDGQDTALGERNCLITVQNYRNHDGECGTVRWRTARLAITEVQPRLYITDMPAPMEPAASSLRAQTATELVAVRWDLLA